MLPPMMNMLPNVWLSKKTAVRQTSSSSPSSGQGAICQAKTVAGTRAVAVAAGRMYELRTGWVAWAQLFRWIPFLTYICFSSCPSDQNTAIPTKKVALRAQYHFAFHWYDIFALIQSHSFLKSS